MKKERIITIFLITIGIILIAIGITIILSNIMHPKETKINKSIDKTEEYLDNYMDIQTTLNNIVNALIKYYPIEDFNNLDEKIKTEILLKVSSTESNTKITKKKIKQENLKISIII